MAEALKGGGASLVRVKMFRDKKEESLGELGIFTNLDKMSVIQGAQIFNESPLNYRKCRQVLSKLLYLLYQTEAFSEKEATGIFFSAIKAFQCKDSALRRLTYLVIKELSGVAEDVIMVTSSLTQDINSKDPELQQYRANAIRALGKVVDASMVSGVERFLKQAIVERDHGVASSALVCAVHFWGENKEVIKRWLAEIQQALNAAPPKSVTQYHALGLLFLLKQGDRMGLVKLCQQVAKGPAASPLAVCLFLRMYGQLLVADPLGTPPLDLKPYLRQSGRGGEMVGLEAARIICERAGDVYTGDLDYAIAGLQSFLGSSGRAIVKFAALRLLNDLASRFPKRVATCNPEIEGLITHSNRNIATLAITALLKTGDEATVDRLVKQLQGYVGEISDEFKVIVVDAVRALCLKFPGKFEGLLAFLGAALREGGGTLEYKQATIDAIYEVLETIPAAQEPALVHLCEFIEDSEYPSLTVQCLHLLGALGPKTKQPSKLVRYIYNRLVLEDAQVRIAAIGALAKFESPGVRSILRQFTADPDDDVRERAAMALQSLERSFAFEQTVPDLEALEARLLEYVESTPSEPFSLSGLPMLQEAEVFGAAKKARLEQLVPSAVASPKVEQVDSDVFAEPTVDVTEHFPAYGPLFKSSKLVPLTDAGAEYTVSLRKHIFEGGAAVLEFVCGNTVPGVLLSDVQVALACCTRPSAALPIGRLANGQTASCFVAFENGDSLEINGASLQFTSAECDLETGEPLEAGYVDKYPIDAFELGIADRVQARGVSDWAGDWSALTNEQVQKFALGSIGSLPEAIAALSDLYGLIPLAGSSRVDPATPIHTLLLAGSLLGHGPFAVRCRMAMARPPGVGVNLEFTVRSASPTASSAVLNALG